MGNNTINVKSVVVIMVILEIIYFYLNMLCLAGSKNKIIDKLIEN
jgi:hypothetical protein